MRSVPLFFPPRRFLHSPPWQLKAQLTPVSAVHIPSGCWLDRPCHYTAGWSDTHQYISTALPLLICRGMTQRGRQDGELGARDDEERKVKIRK